MIDNGCDAGATYPAEEELGLLAAVAVDLHAELDPLGRLLHHLQPALHQAHPADEGLSAGRTCRHYLNCHY